ncbi:general secretion pathway protein G [Kribbella sp. VKM Ac-2527]|uniref:General secretion pathway protein G n=1 Tax=Kribbella caucasensis TaxID=2512215 RepID=A0A4R6JI54_9ACTN|nr:type II secretion system protein [Kribbella sp. VKM Ac-2527]TDO35709.1 general secretion pathway protein G [Kribbella sp. VKM Ac-2527]
MLNRIREARKNESGFTLIELLIVIVILGVLSAVVVFAVGGITDRGEAAACKSEVSTVAVAQEAFFAKSNPGVYAANLTALKTGGLLRSDVTEYVASTDATGKITLKAGPPAGCTADFVAP